VSYHHAGAQIFERHPNTILLPQQQIRKHHDCGENKAITCVLGHADIQIPMLKKMPLPINQLPIISA